jgi:succinoglycan biosynthesis protein ExoL
MKILFVLPVLSEAYYQKRISKIRKLGVDCSVYGFERDHYKGKSWDIETVSLGQIKDEQYLVRIFYLFRSLKKIRKVVKTHDVLYAFNLDVLFLIWMGSLFQKKRKKIIYDVADIRPILIQKGFLPTLMRLIEKLILNQTSLIVVASPAYIKGYFRKIQNVNNEFFVIENKVDEDRIKLDLNNANIPVNKNNITIGYFGGLRCKKSLEFLLMLMTKNSNLKLILRGFFFRTEAFKDEFHKLNNVTYKGPFVNPDDLEEMYSSVDLVWSAHMHGETNTKWAISNRFYQACFFKRPLISQINTQDAKLVSKYNIGCIIDLNDTKKSRKQIKAIDLKDVTHWRDKIFKIPKDVYTLTEEHIHLLKLISNSQ